MRGTVEQVAGLERRFGRDGVAEPPRSIGERALGGEVGVVAEAAGGCHYHDDLQNPVGQRIAELNAEINAIDAGRVGQTIE